MEIEIGAGVTTATWDVEPETGLQKQLVIRVG